MASDHELKSGQKHRSRFRKVFRGLVRVAQAIFALLLLYALIVLLGLIPVNNDFEPTADGIEIYVVSNSVHADLVIPLQTSVYDWTGEFPSSRIEAGVVDATHLAIGWGDKGFFIDTPTWSDLKATTALNALLWPSETCLHVQGCNPADLPLGARSVKISQEQYERIVNFIRDSFKRDDSGQAVSIANAYYGRNDAFFEANGVYHCFNTCNCWIGRCLKEGGIRTGWFTPMPKTVYWYIPR